MSEIPVCYDCKHPIEVSSSGPLVDISELEQSETFFYENLMKADRLLELASKPEAI
jgi:hypothetical protein